MKLDRPKYRRHYATSFSGGAAVHARNNHTSFAAAAPQSLPPLHNTTGGGSNKLPRIGQHYCRQVEVMRQELETRRAPLERRYQDTLQLLARTTDRRVRAQINRQLKSMRLERDALHLRQADAVCAALPSAGCYFDELQRRNAGERGGSTSRDLSQFFGRAKDGAGKEKQRGAAALSGGDEEEKEEEETIAAAEEEEDGGGGKEEEVEDAEELARRARRKRNYQAYWNAQPHRPLLCAADYVVNVSWCGVCGKGEMVHQEDEGTLQCNYAPCAHFMPHITDTHLRAAHMDTQSGDVSYSAYQRQNHFKEIVSQFEALKGTVPEEVYAILRTRMAQERIRASDLNYATMRGLLTRLQLSKQYDNINLINAHFGVRPPVMDTELREALFRLFDELQVPWSRLSASADRNVNVFNYTYILYQLLKLLGQDHLLPFTSMETDRDGRNNRAKQLEQDQR